MILVHEAKASCPNTSSRARRRADCDLQTQSARCRASVNEIGPGSGISRRYGRRCAPALRAAVEDEIAAWEGTDRDVPRGEPRKHGRGRPAARAGGVNETAPRHVRVPLAALGSARLRKASRRGWLRMTSVAGISSVWEMSSRSRGTLRLPVPLIGVPDARGVTGSPLPIGRPCTS
jgi:hypothetical protein